MDEKSKTQRISADLPDYIMEQYEETDMEAQANLLGSAILMPLAQVKRCFYKLRLGRTDNQIIEEAARVFQVSKQAMRIRLQGRHLL